MPRDINYEDFKEILDARRKQYVAGEITSEDMRAFLARNGYTSTEIASEIYDLGGKWLANFRSNAKVISGR